LKRLVILVIAFMFLKISMTWAQSVSFELKTNPTVDFTFNTIYKYMNGIIIPNAITLNIDAIGTQWDMYVGTTTATAGTFDNIQYYASAGNGFPPVGLLQVAFRNSSSTSQISGYVPLQDISTTTLDIIGNHLTAPDPAINCADPMHQGTNTAGDYLTDPQCYQFKVDFRIVPGLTYRAGLYNVRVDIIIARDL
jgi:hypothetical protein